MTGLTDAHVHLFPDAAAGRAWLTGAGIASPRRDGTLDGYRALLPDVAAFTVLLHARAQTLLPSDGGRVVDHPAVLERIRSYNDWGLTTLAGVAGAAPVIGVDPALMSADALRAEIDHGVAAGTAGVKFAPASARIYLDDDRCLATFEHATRHGLPVVVQSGHSGPAGDRGHPYGRPSYLRAALDALPGLRVVLAHFGEGYDDEMIELGRRYEGAHADLSMRLHRDPDVSGVVREFGATKVMFGSNYPIANPARAAEAFRRLGLTETCTATWHRLFGSRS